MADGLASLAGATSNRPAIAAALRDETMRPAPSVALRRVFRRRGPAATRQLDEEMVRGRPRRIARRSTETTGRRTSIATLVGRQGGGTDSSATRTSAVDGLRFPINRDLSETRRRAARTGADVPASRTRSGSSAMTVDVRPVSRPSRNAASLMKAINRSRASSRVAMMSSRPLSVRSDARSTISAGGITTTEASRMNGPSPGKEAMPVTLPRGQSEARPTNSGQNQRLLIAIDGPAAAGKTTVARALADRAGAIFLDTGLLYRAVTVAALRAGISPADATALTNLVHQLNLTIRPATVADGRPFDLLVNGQDLTNQLRTREVDAAVSAVAAIPGVRAALLPVQRDLASTGRVVMVGRDIATVVAPDAELKIYLEASPGERARRRHAELIANGTNVSYDAVLDGLVRRDAADSSREASPLAKAHDAIVIGSDGRTVDEIVDQLVQLAERKWRELTGSSEGGID